MTRYRFLQHGNTVKLAGVDQPAATIHAQSPNTVVLKVPGHKRWSARGEQTYEPASFQVFEEVASGEYRMVTQFPIRKA